MNKKLPKSCRLLKCSTLERLREKCAHLESELAQAQAAAVQWVTYDGTPETMPEMNSERYFKRPVLVDTDEIMAIADGACRRDVGICWDFDAALQATLITKGDRWAYLPQPPQESQK